MKWNELYPKEKQPSLDEVADYVGKVKSLWLSI